MVKPEGEEMNVKRYECGMTNAPTEYQSPTMHKNANGGYVSYEDYAALEARCAALAAENAGLIEQAEEVYAAGYNHGHLNTVDGIAYADCVKDDFYGLAVELMREAETPSTDAFLAEVRAQGVEMLREHPAIKLCSLTHVCDEFSAQLRKGVQS
ncbi:TPA: hypothetical protein ACI4GT_002911 [Enterobacter hormaechei]